MLKNYQIFVHRMRPNLLCYLLLFLFCAELQGVENKINDYIIKVARSIDLKGSTWQLPENAVLYCESNGKIINGTIIGKNANIDNLNIENVRITGTFSHIGISLLNNIDSLFIGTFRTKNLYINGNNHIVSSTSFGIHRNTNIHFKDIVFDCRNVKDTFLYPIGNGTNSFILENCTFNNVPEIELLNPRNMLNPVIRGCRFNGLLFSNERKKSQILLNRFYECKGKIVFESNEIKDCFGIAVGGIGYKQSDSVSVSIKNNKIMNVSNGGIVFSGGHVTNISVENNYISNVYCLGALMGENLGFAENAAINFHGFSQLDIQYNTIVGCRNSYAIDLDGSFSNSIENKGRLLNCSRNKLYNFLSPILFNISDAVFSHNVVKIINQEVSKSPVSALIINSCSDIRIYENEMEVHKPINTRAYPIVVRENIGRKSGNIIITKNTIKTDDILYLMIHEGFSGELIANKNFTFSAINNSPLLWVNNSVSGKIRVADPNVYR